MAIPSERRALTATAQCSARDMACGSGRTSEHRKPGRDSESAEIGTGAFRRCWMAGWRRRRRRRRRRAVVQNVGGRSDGRRESKQRDSYRSPAHEARSRHGRCQPGSVEIYEDVSHTSHLSICTGARARMHTTVRVRGGGGECVSSAPALDATAGPLVLGTLHPSGAAPPPRRSLRSLPHRHAESPSAAPVSMSAGPSLSVPWQRPHAPSSDEGLLS